MTTLILKDDETAVARPLKVLAALIKDDFIKGEQAGMEYYEAAGDKLNEAKDGHFDGDTSGFWSWATKNFAKSRDQLRTYMARAQARSHKSFKPHKNPTLRHTSGRQPKPSYPGAYIHREWTVPVDDIAERARKEQFRLAQEEALTKAQEREAERKLAHRLIDIGYKVLAKELHPDKLDGDREAMRRLNHVREILKGAI